MLTPPQVARIESLLAATPRPSIREIALRTGLSRGAVAAVAAGKPRRYKQGQHFARCPHCGHLVHSPCLACSLPRQMLGVNAVGVDKSSLPAIGLELLPAHRRRYERLKRRRRAS